MYKSIAFFLSVIILSSCKTTQYSNPDDFTGRIISVGEGGGITGKTNRYSILENGQVFLITTNPSGVSELKKLKKSDTEAIFSRFERLGFADTEFSHPGNMTYFVDFRDGSKGHEVKWGDGNFPPPQNILEFYRFVKSQLPLN